jgi:hypothetical protein
VSPAFWIWSHLSFVLLIASMLSLFVKRLSSVQAISRCLWIPGFLGVLPIGQTDVSGFALGHMGTLSASMLVLLGFQFFANIGAIEGHGTLVLRNMNIFWFATGMILYPAALGFFNTDMYSFGFHASMHWCVLGLSVTAVLCRLRILGLCLAFSVLANLLKLHESSNLWDYVIDPWLWIAATVSLPVGLYRQLFGTKPGKEVPANPVGSTAMDSIDT